MNQLIRTAVGLAILLVLTSYAPAQKAPSPTSADDLMMQRVMEDVQRILDRSREITRDVNSLCRFFYRLHGRWPNMLGELAGTPTCDGAPFDPHEFVSMDFQPEPDGALRVHFIKDRPRFESTIQVAKPQATTLPVTMPSDPLRERP